MHAWRNKVIGQDRVISDTGRAISHRCLLIVAVILDGVFTLNLKELARILLLLR